MVTDKDPYSSRPPRRQRVDIHVHRDPGYRDYDYADEPTPAEVATVTSFSIIQAVLLVILLVLVAIVIATLLGAVSGPDIVDALRNLGGGTDTSAQPAQ